MVLKIARDVCGLTLKELGEKMGGLDYVTVHLAIRRLERRLDENPPLRNRLDKIKQAILK
jgi:chromosomal replication initiation ATPase DnaA